MKWIIVIFFLLPFVSAVGIEGLVTDDAKLLTPQQRLELEFVLKSIYDSGKAQVAVVTLPNLNGKDIETVSLGLAQGKLGSEKTNNGLLFLVALEERKYRFEVGRGLEEVFPDIVVGRIGREFVVPNFKEGNYGAGIIEAIKAVQARLGGDTQSTYYVRGNLSNVEVYSFLFFSFLVFSIILFLRFRSRIRGHTDDDYFFAALALSAMFQRGRGGFGGFGHGGFGGGGASGGW